MLKEGQFSSPGMEETAILPPCEYLRKKGTNECFAYTVFLAQRKDMEPWTGPLPWEAEAEGGHVGATSAHSISGETGAGEPIPNCGWLRKRGTDECFQWTPFLAVRKDMEPWAGPFPWEKEEDALTAAQLAASALAAADPAAPKEPSEPHTGMPEGGEGKQQLIVAAIGEITPEDFTQDGLPSINVLKKKLGMVITTEERDAAWHTVQASRGA